MADGELTLKLDQALEQRLREMAADEGVTSEELAVQIIAEQLSNRRPGLSEDVTTGWIGPDLEADRAALDEFQRTRMGVPWEEVEAWMMSWGTDNPLPKPQVRKL
jgi:predicted transcriptional regulator